MKYLVRKIGLGLSYLIHLTPLFIKNGLGNLFGIFFFDVIRLRRNIMLTGIGIAFPEKTLNEKTQIARAYCQNMGKYLVEFLTLPHLDKKWMEKHVVFDGMEHYHQARSQGKGVLMLSMHIGSGDMAVGMMALKGFPVYLITKFFKNQTLNQFWFGVRRKLGAQFIAPEGSSFKIFKVLKEKADVIFVLDQYAGPPLGVEVEFFGKKTGAAYGLALFAQKTGCPVIPLYSYRENNGTTHVCFGPEVPFEEAGDRKETIAHMTQVYTNKIEELVRQYPEQWMWLHKRWKKFLR